MDEPITCSEVVTLPNDYQLLDFGQMRKLERIGPWILDRPAPGVGEVGRRHPSQWAEATARYEGLRTDAGAWNPPPAAWRPSTMLLSATIADRAIGLHLEPAPSGQIGWFPEHAEAWEWIAQQAARSKVPLRVLNLFAYTGGSTLAAAAAGAQVTHVDAARSVVARARRNAEGLGLEGSVRWIVDDALKFCRREVKRGRRYDALILDPPTFGRGPQGETWVIHRDLLALLQLGRQLTSDGLAFAHLSCHTPGIGPPELSAYLSDGLLGSCGQPGVARVLQLRTESGACLSCGAAVRWTSW